jgi:hypothetical protein
MKSYQADQDRQTMLPGFVGGPQHSTQSIKPVPVIGKRETSRLAALSVAETAPLQRSRVFEFIASKGEFGANRDEIAAALELPTQSVSPRVVELIRLGMIRETDRRRPTRSGRAAVVLVASSVSESGGNNGQ